MLPQPASHYSDMPLSYLWLRLLVLRPTETWGFWLGIDERCGRCWCRQRGCHRPRILLLGVQDRHARFHHPQLGRRDQYRVFTLLILLVMRATSDDTSIFMSSGAHLTRHRFCSSRRQARQ
ncbi:uncharacterized protein [Lolium perenne]|uniref:uncharacterized protein n=1 Tax=Lolium perenne TaxID=4522 RepID=UPI003A994A76